MFERYRTNAAGCSSWLSGPPGDACMEVIWVSEGGWDWLGVAGPKVATLKTQAVPNPSPN
jgi:hypothetical protein